MMYFFGVEGGGTKTNVSLSDEKGKIIANAVSGPSNFLITGFKKASENIITAMNKCLTDSGILKSNVSIAMLGLTGAGRALDQNNMKKAFQQYSLEAGFNFDDIVVDSDARISLEAAFPNKPGMIIIAGTGSIMFGKDADGNLFRVGGWGRILGDEGSGLYIGKKGLMAVVREIDGRGCKTLISEIISNKHNLNSLETIVKAVYTDNFDIASLAPSVFEAAEKQDEIALSILNDACDELFLHIKTMMTKIKYDNKIGISFVGSVITNENIVRHKLLEKIAFEIPDLEVISSEAEPVEGAIVMAINAFNRIKGTK